MLPRRRRALPAAVCTALALFCCAPAGAQTGPQTAFEKSGGAAWTTHDQEKAFLVEVAAASARMRTSVIGTTKQGRPLQLVELGAPLPAGRDAALERPTALLVCSQHGNEPAGREACLKHLRDLALSPDPGVAAMLSAATFLYVPAANPDGREADTRANSEAVDVNRDHLALDTAEARAVAAVVRDWRPDVVVDLHEYGPSQPVIYDDSVLWLWPRNLNTDQRVHDLAIELGRKYLVPAANAAGFTTDEYGQAEIADNDIAQTAGDADEGIARNAMGLRHALGILVETRVDADVRISLTEAVDAAEVRRRRVASHLAILAGLVKFMTERGAEVARVTDEARERKAAEGAAGSAPVYFGGADNQEPTPEQTVTPPPCGYRLTAADLGRLGPRLELHGIRSFALADGPFVSLGQPAEPLIPLLLDKRGTRHVVEASPLTSCPATPGGPTSGSAKSLLAPRAPGSSCISPRRTVTLKLPGVKGRVLRVTVRVGKRRVRVRRGVAYVRVGRAGTRTHVRITQRYRSNGRTRTRRTARTFRVCPR